MNRGCWKVPASEYGLPGPRSKPMDAQIQPPAPWAVALTASLKLHLITSLMSWEEIWISNKGVDFRGISAI